jgi:hypothetical protein
MLYYSSISSLRSLDQESVIEIGIPEIDGVPETILNLKSLLKAL